MPRKPIVRSSEHYYHLTARSNNRDTFDLPLDEIWEILVRKLRLLQIEYKLKISALVLMRNHFHLMLLTPEEDIDRVMYFLMKDMTREIQKRTGRINKIFGGRYKGCLITDEDYLFNAYKYIYRNPIAVGISNRVEDYPFSTIHWLSDSALSKIVLEKVIPFNSDENLIRWINTDFEKDMSQRIKTGLSKTIFKLRSLRV